VFGCTPLSTYNVDGSRPIVEHPSVLVALSQEMLATGHEVINNRDPAIRELNVMTYARPWCDMQDLYDTWSYEQHFVPHMHEYLDKCQQWLREFRADPSLHADIV
jgi:hypothetical protein